MNTAMLLSRVRKIVLAGLLSLLMIGSLFAYVPGALAAHPRIRKVEDRDRDAITLAIRAKDYADKRVRIRVSIIDEKTGKKMRDHFTKRLDKDGDATVKIRGLEAGTRYKLYYRVKQVNEKNYKHKSNSERVTTKT